MKPTITKEKFEDYLHCQYLGTYNVFDYNSYYRDGLTNLTKDEWKEIIINYLQYKKKFS